MNDGRLVVLSSQSWFAGGFLDSRRIRTREGPDSQDVEGSGREICVESGGPHSLTRRILTNVPNFKNVVDSCESSSVACRFEVGVDWDTEVWPLVIEHIIHNVVKGPSSTTTAKHKA